VSMPNPFRLSSMWVFHVADPDDPQVVGRVSLVPATKRLSFQYERSWVDGGFQLSPDMPLVADRLLLPEPGQGLPGALDDAMPDRWGQNMIRTVDRPPRSTPLDLLYLAGDRRFGALGVSPVPDSYQPYREGPLLAVGSLDEANEVIQRVLAKQPLNERERNLLRSSKNMGGAHPKMLVQLDGQEWLAKFPKGDPVDLPLVEHATMRLARDMGIRTPDSRALRILTGHVVLTRRFDREGTRRVHALSAKTMMLEAGAETYAAMADVIRARGASADQAHQRAELFRRMVFNMLMDNTDDHSKNHAFLRRDDGHYDLSPAYDLLPQMNGTGEQAIPVSRTSVGEAFADAVSASASFGLSEEGAVQAWREVAAGVSRWKEVFSSEGVTGGDIDYLSDFLDSDDKMAMRGIAERRTPKR
jgi:serine/threonine-protein kinase HipA